MPLRELFTNRHSTRPLVQYLLWPQLLPFVLMVLVIVGVVWGIDVSARQTRRLNEAQQRLSTIDQIARNVLDSETGLRGYLLTGDDQFLGPYRAGQAALNRNLALLEKQPATLLQYQNIQQVRYLMTTWREQVAEPLLASQRSGGLRQQEIGVQIGRAHV